MLSLYDCKEPVLHLIGWNPFFHKNKTKTKIRSRFNIVISLLSAKTKTTILSWFCSPFQLVRLIDK